MEDNKRINHVHWRDEPRTDKQYCACINMRKGLGWTCEIPDTKGECCDLINEMKKEILTRQSICGSMSPKACMNACDDSDEDSPFEEVF